MKGHRLLLPLLALTILVGSSVFCSLGAGREPSTAATQAAAEATLAAAEVTKAAAAQAIAQATQLAAGQPTDTPAAAVAETPAPAATEPVPPMPAPEACARESDPFWHWQLGRVEIQDFFFTTPATGFAVGEPLTLLRTEDGGSHWRVWPIPSPGALNSLHFHDPQVGWAAGNGGTLLKTVDGGDTWQPQESGTQADLYVVEFLDAQTGWAGGANGTVLRTTDGGATWLAGASGVQLNVVDLSFVDALEGYLAGYEGQGPVGYVLHTTDGGATWQDTDFTGSVPQAVHAARGQTTWVVGGWVGGYAWKGLGHPSRTQVLDSVGQGHFRQVLFADEQQGWAVGDNGLAMFTTDAGVSWQAMDVNKEAHWIRLEFIGERDAVLAGYDWVWHGIVVAHSADGGRTWSAAPAETLSTPQLEVPLLDFVDPWFGWAAIVRRGPNGREPPALLATRDGGGSWQERTWPGGGASQIQFVDRLRGWAIGDGGMVARTDDGGQSWQFQSIPFPGPWHALWFLDRAHGWVVSARSGAGTCQEHELHNRPGQLTLFRTSSGGDEWQGPICIEVPYGVTDSYTSYPLGSAPVRLRFVDRQTGWIVGKGGVIVHSTDGGLTWQGQQSGVAVDLTDAWFVDAQTGWVTGEEGVLLATTDGGEHWRQQRPGDGLLTGVRFLDRQTGWLLHKGDPLQILHTVDGGQTWRDIFPLQIWGQPPYVLEIADAQHLWLGADRRLTAYTPVCLSPGGP